MTRGRAWSHDGKWIYFASDRGGGQTEQIWKVPAGGGEPIQVTGTAAPIRWNRRMEGGFTIPGWRTGFHRF